MALSTNSVAEVQTGGSDTNGGSYVTGSTGTDYSTSPKRTSPTFSTDISVTDGVTNATTTVTSATANFGTTIVGNIIYIAGGTGSIVGNWYQVASRTNSTTIVVDRLTGLMSGTGVTINIGGPLASIGQASAIVGAIAGTFAFVKAGTYSITSATANVSGGIWAPAGLSCQLVGYSTNRTISNTDTKPLVQYGVSGVTMMNSRGFCNNIAFDGNGQTTAKFNVSGDTTAYTNCSITNMNVLSGGGTFFNCTATANSVAIFTNDATNCEAYANTATPFNITSSSSFGKFTNCLSYNNTGATTDGFAILGIPSGAKNCISYGNGRAGFFLGGAVRVESVINCHAENNTGWGFDLSTGSNAVRGTSLINCSAYNNTAGTISLNTVNYNIVNFISVTAGSVFVNAASGNFALNNTTNQGALLRAAGAPATFPAGTTTSFLDIGAAQHQDSGTGGGTGFFIS